MGDDEDMEKWSDERFAQLQEELAQREQFPEICSQCTQVSHRVAEYAMIFEMCVVRGEPFARTEDLAPFLARHGKWLEIPYASGFVRLCASCDRRPRVGYAWIRQIPFEKFKQWQLDHQQVYALDEMKAILYNFPIQPGIENGQNADKPEGMFFFQEIQVKPEDIAFLKTPVWEARIVAIEDPKKPKGGFEFL